MSWAYRVGSKLVPEGSTITDPYIVLSESGTTYHLTFYNWTDEAIADISHIPVGGLIGLEQGANIRILSVAAGFDSTDNRYEVSNENTAGLLEQAGGTDTDLLLTSVPAGITSVLSNPTLTGSGITGDLLGIALSGVSFVHLAVPALPVDGQFLSFDSALNTLEWRTGAGVSDGVVTRAYFTPAADNLSTTMSLERSGGMIDVTASFPTLFGNADVDARLLDLLQSQNPNALPRIGASFNDRVVMWDDGTNALRSTRIGDIRTYVVGAGVFGWAHLGNTDAIPAPKLINAPVEIVQPDAMGITRLATMADVGQVARVGNDLRIGTVEVLHPASVQAASYEILTSAHLPNYRGTWYETSDVGEPAAPGQDVRLPSGALV